MSQWWEWANNNPDKYKEWLKRKNKRVREKSHHLHNQGLCRMCEEPTKDGKWECERCLEGKREIDRKRYQDRIASGLCVDCKSKAAGGKRRCQTCLDRNVGNENRKQYTRSYNRRLRDESIKRYGSVCQCCGENESRFLELDHINNNGSSHRKELKRGGISIYMWLKKHDYPAEEMQLLCRNCNYGKFLNNGVCPHEISKEEVNL